MNKTLITLALFGLVALGIIGSVLILEFQPDSFGQFTQFIITITAFALTVTVTIYGLDKVNTKVERIEKNTNGINTALRNAAIKSGQLNTEEIAQLPESEH